MLNKYTTHETWQRYWNEGNAPLFKRAVDSVLRKLHFSQLVCKKTFVIGKQLLSEEVNPVLVEAGCGEATLSLSLKEVYPEARVILIDCSQDVLIKIKMSPGIESMQADISAIPLETESCDMCCNVGTIEHFDDPLPIIREMKRISRKYILCAVPAPSLIWKLSTLIRRIVERDASLWTRNTFYYSESDLRKMFSETGLNNIHTTQQKLAGLPIINIVWGSKIAKL